MGCGCNFGNNARRIEEKNELLNNELVQIEESIRGNPKLEASKMPCNDKAKRSI